MISRVAMTFTIAKVVSVQHIPIGWQIQDVSRLENTAEALHTCIVRPLTQVWVFQVYHAVGVIGMMHRVRVHSIEGLLRRDE